MKPITINTDADVQKLTRPGFHRAAVTLYLKVTGKRGRIRRRWVQRIQVDGRQVDRGLGGADLVTVEEARFAALQNRRAARKRQELPHGVRAAARTFLAAADGCLRANEAGWKPASIIKWRSVVGRHLAPLHGVPLADVDRRKVIELLEPLSAATAKHCRRVIRMSMKYAMSKGWAEQDPTQGVEAALPRLRQAGTVHHAAADCAAAPTIYRRLAAAAAGGDAPSACLATALLTGARSAEVRGMAWSEVETDDGGGAVWRRPAARMKNGKEHVQPLTGAALALVEARPRRRATDLVFTGPAGKMIAGNTLARRLKPGEGVVHGFRSCLKSWLVDNTDTDEAVIEGCLAHEYGSQTARAYTRTDRRAKRRAALELWSGHLQNG